jgi:hypothetical protein
VTNADPCSTALGAPDVVADTAVLTAEAALASRLLQSTVQALELHGVYLGKELPLRRFRPLRCG